MLDAAYLSMPRAALSLRLDSTATRRRGLEMSSSRSSVHSNSSQSQAHTPSSSVPNTPLLPTRPPSPEENPPHPADSNSFLTALAAQERRVLELREELHKADGELEKLKKQWAVHEATKKKNDSRHLQQLQRVNKPLLGSSLPSSDHDSASASREVDRRRTASSSIKPSHRKVFAGSRHTRTLSLLSQSHPAGQSDLLLPGNGPSQRHQAAASGVRARTTVLEHSSVDESGSGDSYRQKDLIMETGKQLVGDFRHGLWNFFEDFKQLTVGDEGITTTGLRDPPDLASRNMPSQQNMEEKRNFLRESPARKPGASKTMRQASKKPPMGIFGSELRVSGSPKRSDKSTEAIGHTSTATGFSPEGVIDANSDDSDDDGWDNLHTPKGPNPRRKDLVDEVDRMASSQTDRSSPSTSMR